MEHFKQINFFVGICHIQSKENAVKFDSGFSYSFVFNF